MCVQWCLFFRRKPDVIACECGEKCKGNTTVVGNILTWLTKKVFTKNT